MERGTVNQEFHFCFCLSGGLAGFCGISPDFSQLGLRRPSVSSAKYQAIFRAISQDNC